MKAVTVFIVEDKALIAENLKSSLEDAGYVVAGNVSSGEQALSAIERTLPDIVLMDIQLAGKIDGIETARRIRKVADIPVIYITDFSDRETLERAKETQPANYLRKPFKSHQVLIAIEIAFYNASKQVSAVPDKSIVPSVDSPFAFRDRVLVKTQKGLVRVDTKDILWVQAEGSYCTIITTSKPITLSYALKSFHEKLLDNPMLMRVHRSYVVNMDKVSGMKGNQLIIGDAAIPVSEEHKDEVQKRFSII